MKTLEELIGVFLIVLIFGIGVAGLIATVGFVVVVLRAVVGGPKPPEPPVY